MVVRDVSCVVCKRFSSFDVVATSPTRSGSARQTKTEAWNTESRRKRKVTRGVSRGRKIEEPRREGRKRVEGERRKKRKSVELIRVRDNAVPE